MKTVAGNYVLYIDDVTVKVKDAKILKDVKFTATTGSLLAILGPSGVYRATSKILTR